MDTVTQFDSSAKSSSATPIAPAIIRGRIIDTNLVEFGGRNGDLVFKAPDPVSLLPLLPMGNPSKLEDMHALGVDEILDYLGELGTKLDFVKNLHLQEAYELTLQTSPTTPSLVRNQYNRLPSLFTREELEDMARAIGRPFIEGWVETRAGSNGAKRYVKAFGARAIHIVAGNSPGLSAVTVIRNAVARGDAIIKAPSNDPFTGIAIARTMIEMAPDHPITKHMSVAYWKGGDEAFESKLYQPHNIEKIVAWGGFASVKHVTKYIQPGIELISLDPKRSISIVGPEALESEEAMDQAAVRIAADFGAHNQEVCASARVIYVLSGSDEEGVEKVIKLGELAYEKLLTLPERISTAPKGGINRDLKTNIDAAAMLDDFYHVIGGQKNEGAVIVSKIPEPVDFAPSLINRVANLVPVDSIEDILPRVDAYCQTVGIFPESLAIEIRDKLALAGAQRIVSLGYAGMGSTGFAAPQDGIEPVRRLCKWIFQELADPEITPKLWKA